MAQAAPPSRDSRQSSFTKIFRSSKSSSGNVPRLDDDFFAVPAKSASTTIRRLSLSLSIPIPKSSKSTDAREKRSSFSFSPSKSTPKSSKRFSLQPQSLNRSTLMPVLEPEEVTCSDVKCSNCGRITGPKERVSCLKDETSSTTPAAFGAVDNTHSFCIVCVNLFLAGISSQSISLPTYYNHNINILNNINTTSTAGTRKLLSSAPLCMKSFEGCENHLPILQLLNLGNRPSKSSTFKMTTKKYGAQCHLCSLEIKKTDPFLECDASHHLFCQDCSTSYVMKWIRDFQGNDDAEVNFDKLGCLDHTKTCNGRFLHSQIISTVQKNVKGLYSTLKDRHDSLFECGCCFQRLHKTSFVQCSEGDLFCKACVSATVNSILFGQGKAGFDRTDPRFNDDPFLAKWAVRCLETSHECSGYFPLTQLRDALPKDIFTTYESKSIEMALAEQPLVVCPLCKFFEVHDVGLQPLVYACKNPACGKTTCTKCKKETFDKPKASKPTHRCDLTTQDEYRLFLQSAKDKALIRICLECKSPFVKTEGCNKMTCRCKAEMCYICRTDITGTGYIHFCQHARDPAVGKCTMCTRCELYKWNDADGVRKAEDDAKIEFEKLRPGATKLFNLADVVVG